MKFSKQFIDDLKGFNKISPSMYFAEGKMQTAVIQKNQSLSFLARLTSDIEIPESFAVGDLSRLLSVLTMLENPEIDVLDGKQLSLKDLKTNVKLALTKPDFIPHVKDTSKFVAPETNITFSLFKSQINNILKFSAIFKTENIIFRGDGTNAYLVTSNLTDNVSYSLGETEESFEAVIKKDNFLVESDEDYFVKISRKGFVYLNSDDRLEYFIPVEKDKSSL